MAIIIKPILGLIHLIVTD